MLDCFLDVCDCVHASFAGDQALDRLPQPGCLGATRLGGIGINRPRARAHCQKLRSPMRELLHDCGRTPA